MSAARGTIDRSRRPAPGTPPRIRLPRFDRFRLKNGLSVLAVRHDDVPQVAARVILPYGAVEDERQRAGTALLTARALTEGTKDRSAGEVAEWLDYLGARFSVEVNYDATELSFEFLSRVFDEALEALAEIVTRPAFAPEEVDRLREERLDEIASGRDEPRVVASLCLGEASFGEHPYGMRVGGIDETVRRLDAAALEEFHRRFYRPAAATLILVGDLPGIDELQQGLAAVFGDWDGAAAGARSLDDPESIAGRRIWGIPWPGPQSEIRIGLLGIQRLDPDYPAAIVMNSILGGLFSSRINMNLREDKGWTYGASSRIDARKRRGPFFIGTAVDSRATVDAVREILSEMERMKADPPASEELELAVNSLTLSLPRLFETAGQVSGRIATQAIYGLPDDYWESYPGLLRAVSPADVQAVARRLIDPERAAIVVVGPLSDFLPDLETLGQVEIRHRDGRPAAS